MQNFPTSTGGTLVNYTNSLTSAENQIYQASTDSADSLAFLIKNRVLISFTLMPEESEEQPKNLEPIITSIW